MSDELKPCPFCGGKAHHTRSGLDERFGYADRHEIACAGCGLRRSAIDDQNPKGGYALNGSGKPKVVAAWNTRTDTIPSPAALIRAALEAAAKTSLKSATFELDGYDIARHIRALAADPDARAQIVKAAEGRG